MTKLNDGKQLITCMKLYYGFSIAHMINTHSSYILFIWIFDLWEVLHCCIEQQILPFVRFKLSLCVFIQSKSLFLYNYIGN